MNRTTTLLLGAITFLASFGAASAARLQPTLSSAGSGKLHHLFIHASKYKTIYDQSGDDNGVAIISQNFESTFDLYDSQGADDFTVPQGFTWTIQEIDVAGVYSAQGPADSENVFFYKDAKGLPGKLLKKGSFTVRGADDGLGDFAINLGKKGIKLKPGTYWVSVQVNMNVDPNGEWGWDQRDVVAGNPAAWQNPGNGFGTGCITWGNEFDCTGEPARHPPDGGIDHDLILKGKTKTIGAR